MDGLVGWWWMVEDGGEGGGREEGSCPSPSQIHCRVSIYDECEQCRVDHEGIPGVYTWSVTIVGLWDGGGV